MSLLAHQAVECFGFEHSYVHQLLVYNRAGRLPGVHPIFCEQKDPTVARLKKDISDISGGEMGGRSIARFPLPTFLSCDEGSEWREGSAL